jgi:hypothetical protein
MLEWNEPAIRFYEHIGAKVLELHAKSMLLEGKALEKLAACYSG